MKKYTFQETTGCTSFGFTVNDDLFYDLPEDQQNEIVDYILIKIKEKFENKEIQISDIVNVFEYDDYDADKEACDQCGDIVVRTIWHI
jgi:hypothetical protein